MNPGQAERQVVYRDPRELKPDPNNARKHSPEQLLQIRRSIDEFTFTSPVLLRENDVVGAGNGRWEAALLDPPLALIPTITISDLTEDQWRAYAIADNKIGLNSTWDEDLLRAEVAALADEGVDLGLVGFSDDEIDELLGAALDFEDGVKGALSAEAEFEPAGTNLVLGAYRVSITRQEYEAWLDGVRLSAGFEKADILAEMRRRMGV